MKYRSSLVLPIAAACLVFLGPNFAAAGNATDVNAAVTTPSAGHMEAMEMVPARATLTKRLDARDMRAGQAFEAKLSSKVELKNGPVLPKGTELMGRVIKDQMDQNGQPSILTLRFTQADLKNGNKIPIKATIVGLYAGVNPYTATYNQVEMPNYWTPKTLRVDQINALHNVDLHSRIAAHNSGVLRTTKKNIQFAQGTEFALAIAARGNGMHESHAMQGMGGGA